MWALQASLQNGRDFLPRARHAFFNPVMNCYRTKDGKVFWLLGMEVGSMLRHAMVPEVDFLSFFVCAIRLLVFVLG